MRSQFPSWRRLSPCAGANIHVLLRGRCSFTIRRAVFDRHVLDVDDAGLAQTPPKGIHQRQRLWRPLVQESYHRERLLRARRERPRGRRTAEQGDELASLHSITSSARARKDSGIVRPIAFAALTLTTSSNLVA